MNRNSTYSALVAALGFVVVALALSCAAAVSRGGMEYGTLTVAFGGPRALETGWPGNTLPTFDTVAIKVSAPDMSTVTTTAAGSAGGVSIQVPAGDDRLVEVTALPAAGGGAPLFAKSYSGSAAADLEEGKQTAVAITLSLSETKIVLPTFFGNGGSFEFADSLTGPVSESEILDFMTDATDFEPDAYGRIFISGSGIRHYTNLEDEPIQLSESQTTDLAYDESQTRLYAMYDLDGVTIRYYDVSMTEPAPVYIDPPSGYEFMYAAYGAGVAASEGFLYATAMSQDVYYLGKFSVPEGEESVLADLQTAVTLDGLGINGDLTIRDMIVKDGVLYIAVAEHGSFNGFDVGLLKSRGKVIAVSTTDLSEIWDLGLSDTPWPTSPATEFYGPVRFIGLAPKKLYVADEGYGWEDDPIAQLDYVTDVNRVVEIDLETGEISGTGLEGEAAFLEDFSGYYAVGAEYGA